MACWLLGCGASGDSAAGVTRDAGSVPAAPLPADMLEACPDLARFDRSGARVCTEIGCLNGFRLLLSAASGWARGSYRFELSIDGRQMTCQGALPLLACDQRSFTCSAPGVQLGESGCALEPSAQGISEIAFAAYPLQLGLRVLRDGTELLSQSFAPQYRSGQPNGPGCPEVCCSASAALTLP